MRNVQVQLLGLTGGELRDRIRVRKLESWKVGKMSTKTMVMEMNETGTRPRMPGEGLPEGEVIDLRAKSQVTIPKKLLKQVGMEEGDKFEAVAVNGEIRLIPVVVYPKRVLDRIEKEIEQAEKDIASGESKVYDSVDAMFKDLESGIL